LERRLEGERETHAIVIRALAKPPDAPPSRRRLSGYSLRSRCNCPHLRAMESALAHSVPSCDRGETPRCPLIETLSGDAADRAARPRE